MSKQQLTPEERFAVLKEQRDAYGKITLELTHQLVIILNQLQAKQVPKNKLQQTINSASDDLTRLSIAMKVKANCDKEIAEIYKQTNNLEAAKTIEENTKGYTTAFNKLVIGAKSLGVTIQNPTQHRANSERSSQQTTKVR